MRRRSGLLALFAVAGPGILAGLSDDDPAGITTYSILGAEHGYALLWVLLLSTGALALFQELALRMGVETGQGLTGLVRERYGVRIALVGLAALLVANLGTTAAEFAGVAASLELAGVSRYVSVPIAAVLVATLVIRGTFRRVEHVLLALGTLFAAYIAAGFLAGPDWGTAATGLFVPTPPRDSDGLLITAAVVGATLAPWGLAFIQRTPCASHDRLRSEATPGRQRERRAHRDRHASGSRACVRSSRRRDRGRARPTCTGFRRLGAGIVTEATASEIRSSR
jgi:NRAMP (natural resistance-associated macrophage protein)-like metal ion transporter